MTFTQKEKLLLTAFIGLVIAILVVYCVGEIKYHLLSERVSVLEKIEQSIPPSDSSSLHTFPQNGTQETLPPQQPASVPTNTDVQKTDVAADPALHRDFAYPYPLTWTEGGVTYSLTGITLGDVPATKYVNKDALSFYTEGEPVHAIVLYVKLRTDENGGNADMTMRRVINEEGDMVAPNMNQFYLPESSGAAMRENTTQTDQPIYFLVGSGGQEFIFTTGGTSNKFFTVRVLPNRTLSIEVEP